MRKAQIDRVGEELIMGVKAYNRGTKALTEQIDREMRLPAPAYDRGLKDGRAEQREQIESLERDLARARAAFQRLQCYLSIERRRRSGIIDRLEAFRDSLRGKADRAHWAAIIALLRAEKE